MFICIDYKIIVDMEISYQEPMEYIENNEEESLDILAQELVNI